MSESNLCFALRGGVCSVHVGVFPEFLCCFEGRISVSARSCAELRCRCVAMSYIWD